MTLPNHRETPTPCHNRPGPFDALLDINSIRTTQHAAEEVIAMCARCDIQPTCWRQNREEPWVQIVSGVDTRKPPVERPSCGTAAGAGAHHKRRERTCQPCKDAAAAARAISRARVAA